MAFKSKEDLIEVQSRIQRLKKEELVPKSGTEELIASVRKDLHRLVIETEGLVAIGTEKLRSKATRAIKMRRNKFLPKETLRGDA